MIIPTILEKSWEEIEKKFEIYKDFAKGVHVDFIDGKFKEETSYLNFELFKKYSAYFHLEAHLMVEEPINYLDDLSRVGFKTFLGHVEGMSSQVNFVSKGRNLGTIGLALDIETPIASIKVDPEDLDQVLLMGVMAGKSGRPFDNRVISKVKEVSKRGFKNIEVDGGVSDKSLPLLKRSGATLFCANSFLFKGDPREQFELLCSLL